MSGTPVTITFNGYALQDSTFKTRIIQHQQAPDRSLQFEMLSREHGLTLVSGLYKQKVIRVEGKLTAATPEALDAKVDEMKRYLSGTLKQLDISYNGTTRRYIATVLRHDLPTDFFNTTIIDYSVEFICAAPFGMDTASGSVSAAGKTAGVYQFTVTVSGTITAKPAFKFTVNSATGMDQIVVKNETRDEEITVSPVVSSFQAADQVVIDSSTKRCYLNGSGLDYSGIFPELNPGANLFTVTVNSNGHNYDLTTQYVPNYL